MADTVLLTGATGFLGTELAARLIREPGLRLYALVRAADEAGAAHRLRSAWHYDGDLCRQKQTAFTGNVSEKWSQTETESHFMKTTYEQFV